MIYTFQNLAIYLIITIIALLFIYIFNKVLYKYTKMVPVICIFLSIIGVIHHINVFSTLFEFFDFNRFAVLFIINILLSFVPTVLSIISYKKTNKKILIDTEFNKMWIRDL